jgi:hypothetical protein
MWALMHTATPNDLPSRRVEAATKLRVCTEAFGELLHALSGI